MWDFESGASLFADAPDEGGEGKELLISPFSPYLSLPAGSHWGSSKGVDRHLWGSKHKAYVHIKEGGNLQPKAPHVINCFRPRVEGGKKATLHGLELPSPAQSQHQQVLQVQEPANMFLNDVSAPTHTQRPSEVSSVVCQSMASEGQAQDKQHYTIRCLAGWETTKTSLCSAVLSGAEQSMQHRHTLVALELCTSAEISPKPLGCSFPLPTPLTILNVQHQLPQNPGFDIGMCVTLGQPEPRLHKIEPPSPSYKNKSSMVCNMLKKKFSQKCDDRISFRTSVT